MYMYHTFLTIYHSAVVLIFPSSQVTSVMTFLIAAETGTASTS